MTLTDLNIRKLKPCTRPYRVREKGSYRGFGVQVSPGGRKTFYMAYSINGKERFFKLGIYSDDSSLVDARALCLKARKLVDQGIDPQEDKKQAEAERIKQEREESFMGSVGQLFQHYIDYLNAEKSLGSARQVQQAYEKDLLAIIKDDMKAKDVTSQHIRLILNRITKRGSMIQANRVRSYLMAAFKHGIEHDNNPMNLDADVLFSIEGNPVRDIPRIVKQENVGNRDLSRDEIFTFWHSSSEYQGMDIKTVIVFKLVLATGGQRIKEVSQARWSEFDLDRELWKIPPERTKNGRAHVVPLNSLTLSMLNELHRITSESEFLFPMRGDESRCMPLASLSRALSRYCERTDFDKFTPRDLRRTCKTRMGELGLSKEIRDRLHNHALNDVSSKHYDRYDYLLEKTKAIEAWGEYLQSIITGAGVTPIREQFITP